MLRVDDRGVGGSGGQLYTSNYDELTGDVVAGVDFLRARPEIDKARIGLLGHSEGGYLVPLAAQRTPIAFAVLMAGPAASGEEVLVQQNRCCWSLREPRRRWSRARSRTSASWSPCCAPRTTKARGRSPRSSSSRRSAGLPPEQQPSQEQLEAQVAATVDPYYRSWSVHDPAPALQALQVPVLAFFGGADLQVPAGQNEPLMRTLLTGKPDATIRTPGLGLRRPDAAGLQRRPRTSPTPSSLTIDPRAARPVRSWLTQRFPVR